MFTAPTARHARLARIAATAAASLALVFALGAIAGCAPAAEPAKPAAEATSTVPVVDASAFPIKVTDDAFREVTFTVPPARVVSLAPANTEIVYGLGMFDTLVGVTTYDDYPAQVKNVTPVGDFTTPNLEAIAAAEPDVILITGGVQADIVAKLEGTGAKVVVIDPQNLAGVYKSIALVGQILGVDKQAVGVVSGMKSELTRIRAAVSGEPTVSAFVEIGWNPLYTAGPGTLLDDLLVQAGGANVVTEKGYVGYSVEQLVKDQPAVYLGTLSSVGDAATLSQRPGYSDIAAVKAKKIFQLSDNLVSRPGPRVIEGVREIAKALHPAVFE